MTLDVALPTVYLAEVEVYLPASGTPAYDQGWGTRPRGTLAQLAEVLESHDTLLASDSGYRSREDDDDGLRVYPAVLDDSISLDRRISLAPGSAAPSVSWGALRLLNVGGRYDAVAATRNCDGRNARVLAANRIWDAARQIHIDPPYADMVAIWGGVATPWLCDDTALEIPVRDAGYWLERPLQQQVYGGTGGLDGGADVTGRAVPKLRGAASNITPVLVDGVAWIYQYSDGPGTLTALYERGLAGAITNGGDVADLYSGSTTPGQYRTDNARCLFQLGSPPQGPITIDATGEFPIAGAITDAITLAATILLEDAGLPADLLDSADFAAAAAAYPYPAGIYVNDQQTGMAAALALLSSLGAKLVPSRTGQLRCLVLRALPLGAVPVAACDTGQLMACAPIPLGAPLDPPPYRWRVGGQRNWTVMTSDLNPTIDADRRSFLAAEYRYSNWPDPSAPNPTLLAYRRPSDPDALAGLLLDPADRQAVADDLGALWGVRRRLYAATLPLILGLARDIGDIIRLTWPSDDLQGGRLGQIIGEQIRVADGAITFLVLV